jgi:hypothetical protein
MSARFRAQPTPGLWGEVEAAGERPFSSRCELPRTICSARQRIFGRAVDAGSVVAFARCLRYPLFFQEESRDIKILLLIPLYEVGVAD